MLTCHLSKQSARTVRSACCWARCAVPLTWDGLLLVLNQTRKIVAISETQQVPNCRSEKGRPIDMARPISLVTSRENHLSEPVFRHVRTAVQPCRTLRRAAGPLLVVRRIAAGADAFGDRDQLGGGEKAAHIFQIRGPHAHRNVRPLQNVQKLTLGRDRCDQMSAIYRDLRQSRRTSSN